MSGSTGRHTRQGLARGQRDPDPYEADLDYGSHEAANRRDLARREGPRFPTISAVGPCSLCETGYVCSFHCADEELVRRFCGKGAGVMSDYFLTIDPADQALYDWAREQNAGIPHWDTLSEVARDWWRRRHEQVTGAAS